MKKNYSIFEKYFEEKHLNFEKKPFLQFYFKQKNTSPITFVVRFRKYI
jgi:hypothetical protein